MKCDGREVKLKKNGTTLQPDDLAVKGLIEQLDDVLAAIEQGDANAAAKSGYKLGWMHQEAHGRIRNAALRKKMQKLVGGLHAGRAAGSSANKKRAAIAREHWRRIAADLIKNAPAGFDVSTTEARARYILQRTEFGIQPNGKPYSLRTVQDAIKVVR